MRGHPATSCCSQNMIYNINLVRSYFYSLDIVSTSYYNNTLHGNTEHLTSFLYVCLAFFKGVTKFSVVQIPAKTTEM